MEIPSNSVVEAELTLSDLQVLRWNAFLESDQHALTVVREIAQNRINSGDTNERYEQIIAGCNYDLWKLSNR